MIDLDRIKNALADPKAPWYGSDLVPLVADLCEEFERLRAICREGAVVCREITCLAVLFCATSIASRAVELRDRLETAGTAGGE